MKKCPNCGGKSYVTDSRDYTKSTRRRRKCEKCGFSYTTYEIASKEYRGLSVIGKALEKYEQILIEED